MAEHVDNYIQAVNNHLEAVRNHLMFMDTRFETLIPTNISMTESERAAWLADEILFVLVCLNETAPKQEELHEAWSWIYGIIYYLFTETMECDHKFTSICMIANQDQVVREDLFPDEEIYCSIRTLLKAPDMLSKLNLALLHIIGKAALYSRAAKNGLIL